MVFRPLAPLLEYQQNDSISFCFGILASVYTVSGEMLLQGIFHCELRTKIVGPKTKERRKGNIMKSAGDTERNNHNANEI